jgi:hypothetical protein
LGLAKNTGSVDSDRVNEKVFFPEERLLEIIIAGDRLSPGELKQVTSELSPDEIDQWLRGKYEPGIILPRETLYELVGLDVCFLGNPFVQATLKEWQKKAVEEADDECIRALHGVGKCMHTRRGPGQPQLIEESLIGPAWHQAYDRIKRFQKAFKDFRPGSVHNNPKVRAQLLIDLSKDLQALNRIQYETPKADRNTVAEQERINSMRMAYEEKIKMRQVIDTSLEESFAECPVEWAWGSAADHADAYIAATWSAFALPNQMPVASNTVRSMRQKLGIKVR